MLDVQNITMLSDGRISATVIVDRSSTNIHPADAGAQKATAVFVKVNSTWLIDEIR